ncbi:hypothetical protein GM415_09290 [Pseudodesulfovibrio cashew]|uniref:Uncharacterized protein n=1 Tax=Pseudodesulfovibrio cashew TaxID=2678688 RepID=A0A6I6JH14_9BACT|nr:hypothetical protein [Pseudodesulfovibrio cashew]QGY40310.1 hypothetical protein GM415_09290 [Pseudodesulfovibrio cashew]
MSLPSLYYDENDYRLLEILGDVFNRGVDRSHFKTILMPYLRPHGIKELAADRGLRMAYAILQLLESLKSNQASDRLKALISLRDETLTAARGAMRNNRARVLVQIMKELIRAEGDSRRQLELAHDFRRAAAGKVGFLRKQLEKYHLLEMPEEWNQVTFDDRVHDANSKGRKTPAHLVMDAWIKGIRFLTVVYYDVMDPAVAGELFAAGRILGVTVRLGIEYRALFRGRFVKVVWCPGGLRDESDVEAFFRQQGVSRLMKLGREVRAYRSRYVHAVIANFNGRHREAVLREFGVELPPVDRAAFARSAGEGEPTLQQLGDYIHRSAMPLFRKRVEELRREYAQADVSAREGIAMMVESLDALDADALIERYLAPAENRNMPDPDAPHGGDDPELLRLSPSELTARLRSACHSSQLTLILSGLQLEDVLEILLECEGRITHLEVFNIKNFTRLQAQRRRPFSVLQQALNEQNAVLLKRLIRQCMDRLRREETPGHFERLRSLERVLVRFDDLLGHYKRVTLRTRIGSGSTGRASRTHGMGFAVVDTLPPRAQREVRLERAEDRVPVEGVVVRSLEFGPLRAGTGLAGAASRLFCRLPWGRNLACRPRTRWHVGGYRVTGEEGGNVVALGGVSRDGNGFRLAGNGTARRTRPSPERINSSLKNAFKVACGFVPAFLTFYFTKEWWVLAYLGGVIWFAITGLRNVIQSVLGGGGLRRSPYLAWNDYVNWERIADSLLYTGFSVPLLDWLCKSVLLDSTLGVTVATSPLLLYTVMALTNGVYISSHNLFRGLPREVAAGNFFRSVLSIPVAMLLSALLGTVLGAAGVADVAAVLQLWAAVISKLSSDCVAGVIEGLADRRYNIAMRRWDYAEKIKQVFEVFSRLEIAFPTMDMVCVLNKPQKFLDLSRECGVDLVPEVIANALDLLYIRTYKPRAREALRQALAAMTGDEAAVFVASQQILARERRVATLFVNGLVGRNFSGALSFYLLNYRTYLKDLEKMAMVADRERLEEVV